MVNFEYYEKQLSKNLVKSIFPEYTLKTLCISGTVIENNKTNIVLELLEKQVALVFNLDREQTEFPVLPL